MKDGTSQFDLRPLAERRRPSCLMDVQGQEDLCGSSGLLTKALEKEQLGSLIFWGPPGSGKTTLGHIVARESKLNFEFFSAATDGLKELKVIVQKAKEVHQYENQGTLLFCDEIHRLNKNQQDAFLPHVESGLLTLIGATTENPSFEVNSALLSRCRVVVLSPLDDEALTEILEKALQEDFLLKSAGLKLSRDVIMLLVSLADGDARRGLNLLESLIPFAEEGVDKKKVLEILHKPLSFDKKGDNHYNLISCLHKSIRASDVQAAVCYTTRMLTAGEDLKYVARRLMRASLEDVGLADPQALVQAMAAYQAVHFMGSPEGHLALVQLAVYLASAPKSNSVYKAEKEAQNLIQKTGDLTPPMEILNAPTRLMKDLGYGRGYRYDHDWAHHYAGTECLPEEIRGAEFYLPGDFGFEKDIGKRLEWWKSLQEKLNQRDVP